jgi:hypothetical protein
LLHGDRLDGDDPIKGLDQEVADFRFSDRTIHRRASERSAAPDGSDPKQQEQEEWDCCEQAAYRKEQSEEDQHEWQVDKNQQQRAELKVSGRADGLGSRSTSRAGARATRDAASTLVFQASFIAPHAIT